MFIFTYDSSSTPALNNIVVSGLVERMTQEFNCIIAINYNNETDIISIVTVHELDGVEAASFNYHVSDYLLNFSNFEYNKRKKIEAIDLRTDELIQAGFMYNGESFSLSLEAQLNWIGLLSMATANLLTYPVVISTKESGTYDIVDINDMYSFSGQAMVAASTPIASGQALKGRILAATNEVELAAIVDDR